MNAGGVWFYLGVALVGFLLLLGYSAIVGEVILALIVGYFELTWDIWRLVFGNLLLLFQGRAVGAFGMRGFYCCLVMILILAYCFLLQSFSIWTSVRYFIALSFLSLFCRLHTL